MKVILLLMLVVGAAVSSIAGTCSWDTWRAEARQARQEARQLRLETYRIQREARRSAFAARFEMRREMRDAFRSR